MKNLKIIVSAIVLIFSVNAFSQRPVIDSLLFLIKNDKADTNKVNHLNTLCREYIDIGLYDTAMHYGNSAMLLAEKLNFKNGSAMINSSIGIVYKERGDYSQALDYYFRSLQIAEELNNKKGIEAVLGNIGVVYLIRGEYLKALDYNFKALKIAEEIKNKSGIAMQLGSIGNVYFNQSEYSKTLDYYFKALKLDEELKNKNGVERHFGNIGSVYNSQGDYPKALEYYFKALKIAEEIGDKSGIAIWIGNIGTIYDVEGNYPKALDYYFKALKINEELGDKQEISNNLSNIGTLYTSMGKFKDAEQYFKKAIAISDSIGAFHNLMTFEEYLSQLYDTTEQYQLALIHYKKSVVLKDTIFSQENKKELVRKEMNFEFEKKEAITKAVAEGETRKQKIITFSVTGGLLLVMVFAGFVFRSLRVTKKQKLVIEQQKQLVEEHQKEIISSITYAKRLQEAILPPIPSIKKQFPESFILYNPKDVVAGDFYWMEIMDNIQFIAAADCTGHGVPGAMMSVVCSNALNRAVKEFGLRDTGTILDKVTDLVLETFEKSDSNVKDGMDISILAYNKGNNQIQWSGANNPLWYIQNGNMFEIKADKQPIGLCDNRKPFTTQHISYSENSIFYLFTDGYADQFGGDKGKKFMYKRFKDNLTAMSNLPLSEQEKALQTEFQGWKGNLEQVDDVTVIGIRV